MNAAKAPKKLISLTKSERYAMLALRKESIEDLARALGEDRGMVGNALSETRKYFRIRSKIAAHLGLTYEHCWGETDPTEGQLKSRGPKLRLATQNEDTPNKAHP